MNYTALVIDRMCATLAANLRGYKKNYATVSIGKVNLIEPIMISLRLHSVKNVFLTFQLTMTRGQH